MFHSHHNRPMGGGTLLLDGLWPGGWSPELPGRDEEVCRRGGRVRLRKTLEEVYGRVFCGGIGRRRLLSLPLSSRRIIRLQHLDVGIVDLTGAHLLLLMDLSVLGFGRHRVVNMSICRLRQNTPETIMRTRCKTKLYIQKDSI